MLNRLKAIAAALVGRTILLRPRYAVFIDGDGVSPKEAKRVLDQLATEGHPHILRAYGNYNGRAAEGWAKLIRHRGIVARHMPSLVPGKNATDIALAIDAIEVLLTRSLDTFVLIVSDADFTPLARRLGESGKRVLGYGNGSTPESFRRSCAEFTVISDLRLPGAPRTPPAPLRSLSPADAEQTVLAALTTLSKDGEPVEMTELGQQLADQQPRFDCRVYGRRNLTALLRELPSVTVHQERGRHYVSIARPPD